MLYLLERPELRMHYEEDREEKKKVLHPAGFRAYNLSVSRCALFLFATTAAQQHPVNWAVDVAQW